MLPIPKTEKDRKPLKNPLWVNVYGNFKLDVLQGVPE
jgi:hypothetical protein